jgi:hypothetical protein
VFKKSNRLILQKNNKSNNRPAKAAAYARRYNIYSNTNYNVQTYTVVIKTSNKTNSN